jgi:tetratricopeptide (TPR) repeat protein
MKKYLFTTVLLLAMAASYAQTKPKQTGNEKPPSQKEMEDMMKQMQQQMDSISPEDKKMMEDMGVKMPAGQNVPKQYGYANQNTTEQQVNSIAGIETIPSKDAARIAKLPKMVLTDAQLLIFLQNVTKVVSPKISPVSKKIADDAYAAVKKKTNETIFLANAANGLWINGEPEAAIDLMSRAVMENPADPDNLNNYASFLTMNGGEHLALPILLNLNKKYPGNSTILNNIGQAWFGLGDLNKSEKFLDSAIFISAGHSEANYTKCIIEESKGNNSTAVECVLQSIKTAYSEEKIKKLEKLGGKLKQGDISWNFPKPGDALGLDKMLAGRPAFYFTKSERETLYPKWLEYLKGCQPLFEKYMPSTNENEILASQTKMMDNVRSGKIPNSNFIMDKALRLLNIVTDDENEFQSRMEKKSGGLNELIMDASIKLGNEVTEINERWEKAFQDEIAAHPPTGSSEVEQSAKMDEIHARYMQSACQESKPKIDLFLGTYNRKIYDLNVEWVSRMKYFTNEIVYYLRYSSPTEGDYQKSKNLFQSIFLACIAGNAPFFTKPVEFQPTCNACAEIVSESGKCEDAAEDDGNPFAGLPDFDIIHCNSHIVLWTPVGKAHWDCNIETVEMDLGILKGKRTRNLLDGQTISASAELGIYKGIGSSELGPVKAELKAGGGGFIEWGPKGVTDFGLVAGIKAEVGAVDFINPYSGLDPGGYDVMTKPGEPSGVLAGAEARFGWNSGPSVQGQGIFSGLSIDSK